MKGNIKNLISILIVTLLITSTLAYVIINDNQKNIDVGNQKESELSENIKKICLIYNFSEPYIRKEGDFIVVNVKETELQSMGDGRPVLPYNLTKYVFPFGTKIINVKFENSTSETYKISKKISYASCSTITKDDKKIYNSTNNYPSSIVTYHKGGGLCNEELKTFFNLRVNPVIYIPKENKILFTNQVKVEILYKEPEKPIIKDNKEFDLLIVAPNKFSKNLNKLVEHKNSKDIDTKLITIEEIYENYRGSDDAEKLKLCIKDNIEKTGIKYVLLVGGLDRQTRNWNIPARYSHVKIREGTQEFVVPSFLCDLYFADIYDSEGNFSSWDTNNNNKYAEYDNKTIDKMDLYPDVRLGRLACRTNKEVKTMVDKIIKYEEQNAGEWFKNLICVSGDHWKDENGVLEGVLIMEKASEILDDFEPVNLFADDEGPFLVRDIRKALNKGGGFAYFCGHGTSKNWGIYPPGQEKIWLPTITKSGFMPFFRSIYMDDLKNKNKLLVTLVGGCNNGQFDETIKDYLKLGKLKFISSGCWAWKMTVAKNGGSIATIANTDLGTHAMDDSDFNGINDYLEVYDGWLELKFFNLYSKDNINSLGTLHQEAITEYLNIFLGNNDEMDIKMVQQWELFGDPSLEIKTI